MISSEIEEFVNKIKELLKSKDFNVANNGLKMAIATTMMYLSYE